MGSGAQVVSDQDSLGGIDAFIADVSRKASHMALHRRGTMRFIVRIGEEYAYIQLRDVWRPLRFLRQMASDPPVQFGTQGFDPVLVDDPSPARHYTAFVVVGFWLPHLLAVALLWAWEALGFLRYGSWSPADIEMGYVGIRHGGLVRRYGAVILPGLIASELAEK